MPTRCPGLFRGYGGGIFCTIREPNVREIIICPGLYILVMEKDTFCDEWGVEALGNSEAQVLEEIRKADEEIRKFIEDSDQEARKFIEDACQLL